jgi:TatD DNase family protein
MNSQYIDTHAHLNLSAFNDDVDEVSQACSEASVSVINVGTKESTSKRGVELAERYEDQYAIIGLHPIQTLPGRHDEEELGGGQAFKSKGEEFDKNFYRELAKSDKVIGIGECGFDYYHTPEDSFTIQEKAFIEQIELANELELPLMIHTRGPKPGNDSPTGRSVYADVYDTLKQYAKVPFNVHFYAGTIQEAEKFFELGGTISFTGVITFAKDYEEVVKWAPLDKIHAETDSPYVSPVPHRGKRCEPHYVIEVYKKIAELKAIDEEEVRAQLISNAQNFYSL